MVWGQIGAGAASAAVGGLLGGKNDGPKGGGRAEEWRLRNNPLFSAQLDHTKGQDYVEFGAKGALKDYQMGGLDVASLARTLGMDFLGGLGSFSPQEIAQMQYDILSPMLAEQENQDRLALEGRLFAQGQLGGTAGGIRQNALYDAQADSRRRLLYDSLGLGLQAQGQQLGMAQGLFGIGGNALSEVLNIQGMANQVYNTGTASQGGGTVSQAMSPIQALGAGLVNSGIGSMVGGIDQLFTPQARAGMGPYSDPYTPAGTPTRNGWALTVGR